MNRIIGLLCAALVTASSAHAGEIRTATLAVTRMDCAVCPITVRKALEKVPGVQSAKVDFESRRAVVAFDPARAGAAALTKATADAGYPSSVQQVR